MALDTRLASLITAMGTDYKTQKTWIFGSTTGTLADLATTNKTSIVAAINETRGLSSGSPADASETVKGVAELATQAETNTGTDDLRIVTPLKLAVKLAAFVYATATETAAGVAEIATQAEVTTGTDDVRYITPLKLATRLAAITYGDATESVKGIIRLATQTQVNTGTDDTLAVTPLKFQTRLAAYAQPLNASLTALNGVTSTTYGRARLGDADAAANKVALGLAAVASSGSASDITTGTLPTSVLPPLAISEFFTAANQAAMLALTAQRGDVVSRTDLGGKMYILSSDSPSTLADWKAILAAGDVSSVAGRTGAVTLTSADVGLGSVDNTSDANKPVSTAQATADGLRLLKTANLSDVASASTALTNLGGQAASTIGNADADLVALYTAAKA